MSIDVADVTLSEAATDRARETGPALDAHHRFILWLVPAVNRFPRTHKFLLGDRIESVAMDVLEALIEAACTRRSHVNLGIDERGPAPLLPACRGEGRGRVAETKSRTAALNRVKRCVHRKRRRDETGIET